MSATLEEILDSPGTGRPIVMGVLNITPDSFSDGGRFEGPAVAVAHAGDMADQGADILDVGAESARPGAERVSADEQIRRLAPVLEKIVGIGPVVSVDTTRAAVARFALDAGATIINDITAGRDEPELLSLAAQRGAAVVLMHMRGQPKLMQDDPRYDDVVAEVRQFLIERLAAAESAGLPRRRCIVDPGIGFGKDLQHNLELLGNLSALADLGAPLLVAPSRKRFIGTIANEPEPTRRLGGTIAACLAGFEAGATIFRVHDVAHVAQALAVAAAIRHARRRSQ